MNYILAEFCPIENEYVFRFDDNRYTFIDLSREYPNYREPNGKTFNNKWHFTIIKNKGKLNKKIGDVEEFEYLKLRKFNTNVKEFWKNNILYRKTTQTEYDKFRFLQDSRSDNGKIFYHLYSLFYNESFLEEINLESDDNLQSSNNQTYKYQITYI